MDVLNKLYCTVSSTVSQLSTVLPGNPVTREYEAINHIASAGQGLLWKIYSGYKKSTQQEASIFLLEKRQLDRWPKSAKDSILECIRKGVSQLARLRHPQILVIQHTLEESRDSLAFATEPVFASLANILGKADNMPSPLPPQLDNFNLYEVEIKYGLLQLAEGLSFLHNDVRLLHRNICPQNIIINKQGAWKIFGFDFCVHNLNGAEREAKYPTIEYHSDVHEWAQPELDYLAPECGLSGILLPASDIYSFGMLIYALYSHGQPLFPSSNIYSTYKKNTSQLKRISVSNLVCVISDLKEIVRLMLNFTPELRPDIHEFMKISFFEDVGVKALNYLDSLFQWDNLQKSQFYKGLPQVIDKLPHRVCLFRIIPCLAKEFVNPTMVPFVLPNVFTIAEQCNKDEFTAFILPHLKPVMRMQEPIQILLICMQKMELLLKLTPAEDVKSDVLPMFFRALESDAQQIQELCLSVLPTFASLIDYPSMKNALMPRIKKLCISTSYISVRVNCLVCIGKLMEHLDKWQILDDVIPFLPQIPSKEPAVIMSIIGIYKMVLTHKKITIPKEVLAGRVLPFIVPFCIENSLTLNQFNALISVIKDMMSRVENEQRAKLEQLNSIQEQQKSLDMNSFPSFTNGIDNVQQSTKSTNENDFQDIFGVKDIQFTSNKQSNSSSGHNMEQKTLNLEQKQRLSKQNDLYQRLQNEPMVNPIKSPTSHNTSSHSIKDLTSTLIDSNLAQMNRNTLQKKPSWPQQNLQSPTTSFTPFQNTSLFNSQITQPLNTVPSTTGFSPAAFFTPNMNGLSSVREAKPLSSSEINDFLT